MWTCWECNERTLSSPGASGPFLWFLFICISQIKTATAPCIAQCCFWSMLWLYCLPTPASSVSARPPGLSFSLSLPLSPCLCLTAVRVRGDAARAARHRAVSGQPAVAAQARSQRVATTAFAPGRATGAGGGGEPQQRQAVHGHRPPWTPLPQTGAGGSLGGTRVQSHSHLPGVPALPGHSSAPGRPSRSIAQPQRGEYRVGEGHQQQWTRITSRICGR